MNIPKNRRSSSDIFINSVKNFPMVSVNIILQNDQGEFLFVKRKNNPAKGEWWVPGGRLFSGETVENAAHAILKQETGLKGNIVYISKEYFEEIFDTKDFTAEDYERYSSDIKCIHYFATAVVMKFNGDENILVDDQSSDWKWSKKILSDHPVLRQYFKSCNISN